MPTSTVTGCLSPAGPRGVRDDGQVVGSDGRAVTQWRTPAGCGEGACVGVAREGDEVLVRDTKTDDGPVLRFTIEEWAAFDAAMRAGEFDDLAR